MPFAVDFRRIVAPRLQRDCQLHALRVAIGEETYSEATGAVLSLAYRLGAGHLPRPLEDDLHDVVADWLMAALEIVLPEWEAAVARADKVARDIARWESEICPIPSSF